LEIAAFNQFHRRLRVSADDKRGLMLFWIGLEISDYTQGKARIKVIGYTAKTSSALVNKEFKMSYDFEGCMWNPITTVRVELYNNSTKGLVKTFGFQMGSVNNDLGKERLPTRNIITNRRNQAIMCRYTLLTLLPIFGLTNTS